MEASLSLALSYPTRCSTAGKNSPESHKLNKSSIKVNGFPATSSIKVNVFPAAAKVNDGVSQSARVASPVFTSAASLIEELKGERMRRNIPTKKQSTDPFRQCHLIEGGSVYHQAAVIRSCEVGPDRTATLESMLNLLQEAALNHVWMSGLLGDGFGATHGMMRYSLIWVVTRMHVQVDQYPIWGEVVEIDTWVAASGKNGMRRDWVIRSHLSGQVFARGTSTWVMMNRETRRLSKMPEEVRDEISPWFIKRQAIKEEVPEKIIKLDDNAKYVSSDLRPKRSDLDMNHHVNNVKYVRWMLETIPDQFLENYQLSSIILEYRRECCSSDTVQSICELDAILYDNDMGLLRGFSLASEVLEGRGLSCYLNKRSTRYTHLLQIKGEHKNEEIVRGRTTWRKKLSTKH